ncbi:MULTISPECIES: helix-turn-helix domain-containing protein [unclassified Aureimonas]|uniref:helix-turn-helix domain-containing protein n=1 Tax=unclassified Aureimonas TaxID=2615206 RepID=UPI0006FEDF6D|nr:MULTISPECIES: helix-turn-helix domain-containing protein [unclassified Aureimonas]KQT54038.1 MerR family transcriptional regulator [Aureimonas sp. Leaf427]KQT71691.1 MerR family transcriptional regulator [Aureimonas sp. Leaf460]
MRCLDIGEVAARSGIKPSALRHYEEAGLISSVSRHGLRRQFPPEVLLQLRLISMGKLAGFSLAEIAGMFGKDGVADLPRIVLREKAAEIDRQIRQLTALRDTLRHVADCPAPSHMDCPTFRRLVHAAGKPQRAGSKIAKSGKPNA